jgi:hypothetical protein
MDFRGRVVIPVIIEFSFIVIVFRGSQRFSVNAVALRHQHSDHGGERTCGGKLHFCRAFLSSFAYVIKSPIPIPENLSIFQAFYINVYFQTTRAEMTRMKILLLHLDVFTDFGNCK